MIPIFFFLITNFLIIYITLASIVVIVLNQVALMILYISLFCNQNAYLKLSIRLTTCLWLHTEIAGVSKMKFIVIKDKGKEKSTTRRNE